MEGLALFVGHMLGDFIAQSDWMAANKNSPPPGPDPSCFGSAFVIGCAWPELKKFGEAAGLPPEPDHPNVVVMREWLAARRKWWVGHLACTIHCLFYTLCCCLTSFWFLPLWAYPVIFLAHWPVDRFSLARRWMTHVSGQKFFASKEHPMWPNSIVVVDNTIHLLVLFVLGMIARS